MLNVVRFRGRGTLLLVATSLLGLVGFTWPLLADATGSENLAHSGDAPWLFALLLPLLLAVLIAEVGDRALDAKAIAVLGVLVACGAALRGPTIGVTGVNAMFFLLVPGGRVFGPGFGFVQGALTMFTSALLTGGVGPWLPYQMLGAAWIGLFAGCLPRASGRAELALLMAYGTVSGLAYGMLLDLWFWPFGASASIDLGFVAGDPVLDNLRRFWSFHLTTALGFDIPRALGNAALLAVGGGPVLAALRRASRRAAFGAPVVIEPAVPAP